MPPDSFLSLTETYPDAEHLQPTIAPGSPGWVAWVAANSQREGILASPLTGGGEGPEQVAWEQAHAPSIGMGPDGPVLVWVGDSAAAADSCLRWSRRVAGAWEPPRDVAGSAGAVSAVLAPAAQMTAVWCRRDAPGTYVIQLARLALDWSTPVTISGPAGLCQRPSAAVDPDGGLWVAWDHYLEQERRFEVVVTRVGQQASPPPQAVAMPGQPSGWTTSGASQLCSSIVVDQGGTPWVTWLSLQDVENDDGVVDQWPTVRAARFTDDRWQLVVADGEPDLAELAWGLLSRERARVLGYLGRRRRPLLLSAQNDGVWLVWERKLHHDGATADTPGQLWGRHLSHEGVGDIRELASGPRWYAPLAPSGGADGALTYVARSGPPDSAAHLVAGQAVLPGVPARLESSWSGWRPVQLGQPGKPPDADPHRPAVTVAGQALRLYWADLHSHTGLSADAEGELDELITYARDKAGLDCLVLQDNDFYRLALAESEYRLYQRWMDHHDQPGRFVLLPAYEWTYMNQQRRQPSHRTVIAGEKRLPLLSHHTISGDPHAAIGAHAAANGAILHAHHEHWILSDSAAETNLEVCSGWGVHFLDPVARARFHAAAAERRLGFVAGSDNHRRNPGLGGGITGIYATDLSRTAIRDALRAHRTVATTGAKIALRLWAGGADATEQAFIGGQTVCRGAPVLRWQVDAPRPPVRLTLYRDGRGICTWEVDGPDSGETADLDCADGAHFYYLEAIQRGSWRHWPSNLAPASGPYAWTSPVWIERKEN